MTDINIPRSSFLITRMLDELVALIVTFWEIRDGGVDKLKVKFEGENPVAQLKFFESLFDPYKHLNISDFMVNLGSYLSELIRSFELDGIGEMGILMDYLKDNVDKISYAGSVIHRIEHEKKLEREGHSDFN